MNMWCGKRYMPGIYSNTMTADVPPAQEDTFIHKIFRARDTNINHPIKICCHSIPSHVINSALFVQRSQASTARFSRWRLCWQHSYLQKCVVEASSWKNWCKIHIFWVILDELSLDWMPLTWLALIAVECRALPLVGHAEISKWRFHRSAIC